MLSKNLIAVYILGLVLLGSCGKDESDIVDSGKIKTGPRIEIFRQIVPAAGAFLQVSTANAQVDSMSLQIRPGTYSEDKEFVISYYEIQSHAFGAQFNPVSPLIEVENGGAFGNKVMYMSFKTAAAVHQKLAPFYYDRASGRLESIPIISSVGGRITIAVRHFSLIVVGAFEKEVVELGGFYETYFDPELNGWSFANEGTWSSLGNCAGMSMGAAYYYQNRKTSLLLKEHFDNNGYGFKTPQVPVDDADGLRFVSALQDLYNKTWEGGYSDVFAANFSSTDEDNFWSMAYSMYLNHDPQLLYVGNAINSQYAHMVLATAFEFIGDEVHIKIYDPNYPKQLGIMKYNAIENRFLPYVSAENAQAIENNRYYEFRQIVHIPLSSIVSVSQVDALFLKTANHTIASELFPSYEVYANPLDTRFSKVKLKEAFQGDINKLPFDEFYITVETAGASDTLKFSEALHYLNPQTNLWEVQDPSGLLKLLQPKGHWLGVHVTGERFGNSKIWVGFHYYKIEIQKIWLEAKPEEASPNQEVEFTVRSNGMIPDGARLSWDFGNGKKKTVYNDTITSSTYSTAGEYNVAVQVFDVAANKEFGNASIKIQVKEKQYDRLNISFTGNNAGDKPFLFDDGHQEATLSYSNVPAFYALPKLTWSGLSFNAEFDYGDTTTFYKQTMEGILSADLSTIKELKASYYTESDQSIYESSVIFKNLPIKERDSEQMLIDIRGIATNDYFVNASAMLKIKMPNGSIVTKYSLNNVDRSKARIYVYFSND